MVVTGGKEGIVKGKGGRIHGTRRNSDIRWWIIMQYTNDAS